MTSAMRLSTAASFICTMMMCGCVDKLDQHGVLKLTLSVRP